MKISRRYAPIFLAALLTVSIVFTAVAPLYAADLTGKTVTAVTISGNTSVAQSTILAAVATKPGEVWTADKIKKDLQSIYDLGYFFDVVANFSEVPEGVKVIYSVMENPMLKEIAIKGNTKVTTEKLLSLLALPKGKILNTKELNDKVQAIGKHYHDLGYILAKVSDVSMNPNGTLSITINEGMLEDIVIKGNDKTKTNVVTREMNVKKGEPFNAKDARRSMQKVYNLGYFEDVNMKLNPGREPNSVVLETSVVEQKTGTFSIGAGYSKADGLVGIIELGDNNFRGTGDKVKLHWEFGGNGGNKNYDVSYTRPWLDDKQTSLSFSLYDMTNEYNDYEDNGDLRSTYDKNRKGFEVTLGRPEGEYTRNYISFKNRRDTHVEYVEGPYNYAVNPPYPSYLKDNFGLTRSVTLARVYDSRDNVFNPTEGRRVSLSAEFAGKMFGGDFDFNKYTLETRQYFKVGREQIIALRGTMGYADGKMPESGRFSVGGADTLRGYEDDRFKGDKMLAASAEYRFPIAKKVQGVVFADIGKAWEGEGYKLNDLEASAGVGVRVETPIGPIRLDVARGSEGTKTHFSFGGQF